GGVREGHCGIGRQERGRLCPRKPLRLGPPRGQCCTTLSALLRQAWIARSPRRKSCAFEQRVLSFSSPPPSQRRIGILGSAYEDWIGRSFGCPASVAGGRSDCIEQSSVAGADRPRPNQRSLEVPRYGYGPGDRLARAWVHRW